MQILTPVAGEGLSITNIALRARVVNSPGAKSEQFKIGWTGANGAFAGKPLDSGDILQSGERWAANTVTLVNPIDLGATLTSVPSNPVSSSARRSVAAQKIIRPASSESRLARSVP